MRHAELFPISRKLRGAPLLYSITEVRLITFRSAIFARSVRISSCTPSAKNAFCFFVAQIFEWQNSHTFFRTGWSDRRRFRFLMLPNKVAADRQCCDYCTCADDWQRIAWFRVFNRDREALSFLEWPGEALRSVGVSQFSREKIHDFDFFSVFHLAFAKLMEMWPPVFELLEVFRDPLGEKNVAGIAAIHHSLRHVDARAGHVRPFVYIHYAADRAAVHAHAHPQI